jgi:hypothetical protein
MPLMYRGRKHLLAILSLQGQFSSVRIAEVDVDSLTVHQVAQVFCPAEVCVVGHVDSACNYDKSMR